MLDRPLPLVRARVPLGFVLLIASVAQAMVILDGTIVNVALPAMKASLDMSATQQQWVVDAFLVAAGGLLLPAARAAGLFGQRRVLQSGIIVFTLASLVGGLAQSAGMLIAARAVQGLGAAALAPASLSLITATHTEPTQRARAMAVWGAASGTAGSLGIVLGGILTTANWRWVLLVNVPIGVLLLVATAFALNPAGHAARVRHLDVPGALTATGAVTTLLYGLSHGSEGGWTTAGTLVCLIGSAVLFAAFAVVEVRSRDPLVPPAFLARAHITGANALMGVNGLLISATLLVLSIYLQELVGYSALRTGLALLPLGAALAVGAISSERLAPRLGARVLTVLGILATTGALAWQAELPTDLDYPVHLLGPILLFGLGVGLGTFPVTLATNDGVAESEAGLASGLTNTARQLGGAVGVSMTVTIASTVAHHAHSPSAQAAALHGYRAALLVLAAVCALSLSLAPCIPSTRNRTTSRQLRGRTPSPAERHSGTTG